MLLGRRSVALGVLAWLGLGLGSASAMELITFDEGSPPSGTVVNTQYQADFGLTISADNTGGGPDLAVLFDSSLRGTRDPDLEFAATGNLAFFNILIIQENSIGCDDPGDVDVCDEPDDEGGRPAGSITLAFEQARPITSLGFDLLDIEGPEEMGSVTFYSGGAAGTELGSFAFEEFMSRDGAIFGDNSANRISPIEVAAQLGMPADTVVFRMGGSGALDNLRFALVPEPATAGLLGLGLLGLARAGRRRQPGGGPHSV